ncbi:hypothetical protein RclHR1_03980004 [Rhizophagus clarus]|uniref:DUF4112 domain-containing protein n=1 Tax=Rhizophagus clarus TaxID=94130 RepID=A0A2Z6RDU8_9GLOM|nr:hypothetical protein RclHR1_03980004 [Rhizophagus clarus]
MHCGSVLNIYFKNAREAQILYDRIRKIALLLDSIPLQGTNLPFGLESIIGFIVPTIGDIVGLILGLYQIYLISFFDVPLPLLLRMFMHVLIDCIIGIVPIVANIYNLNILETWLKQKYGNNIRIYEKSRN